MKTTNVFHISIYYIIGLCIVLLGLYSIGVPIKFILSIFLAPMRILIPGIIIAMAGGLIVGVVQSVIEDNNFAMSIVYLLSKLIYLCIVMFIYVITDCIWPLIVRSVVSRAP
jgi:cellulose synthase/poly-beta-1,6-N-acetylglucosamine synthase-like glycosyltransferase